MITAPASVCSRRIAHIDEGGAHTRMDCVAVEEPLEIRLVTQQAERTVTITMRTPGADHELAVGFLLSERIIEDAAQIESIQHCGSNANIVKVRLRDVVVPRLEGAARTFASSSSCGLCGKSSLEAVAASIPEARVAATAAIDPALLQQLPDRLRAAQVAFESTGGLHAVAAFDFTGRLLALHEDVGRHNALDKLVGALARERAVNLSDCIVVLSGRAGFEMIQKAAVARAPMVVAIGAPSSLAVELAERVGMTLIGFLRARSFNVYSHPQRVAVNAGVESALT